MSRPPWQADHDLDADGARARIAEAFPDFAFESVRYFAEGFDFRIFEVDGVWLFRFPKREAEAQRLDREVALMARIADRLPVQVARYEYAAPGLAGYRKMDGLRMVGQASTAAFVSSLAALNAVLHAIPAADLSGLPLPGEQDEGGPPLHEEVRDGLKKSVTKLEPGVLTRCNTALDAPVPAPYAGPPRLVHNDLYPEHLLLAPDGGIAAVLDWGDAVFGDPATDFAVAAFWGGPAFLEQALASYPLEMDAGFQERARFGATCMAIAHITYGARAEKPEYLECGVSALDRLGPA